MTQIEFTQQQRAQVEELLMHVRQYLHGQVEQAVDNIALSFGVSPDATRTDYTARYEQPQQVAQAVAPAEDDAPRYTPEQVALHAEVASLLRGAFAQGIRAETIARMIKMKGDVAFRIPQATTLEQHVIDDEAGKIARGERNHSIVNMTKLKYLRDLLRDLGVEPQVAPLLKERRRRTRRSN